MTRINVVAVQDLSDKHLLAEYKELPRIFTAVLKHQANNKKPLDFNIPAKYKLGTGHVTFFYDKCLWLRKRYAQIYAELSVRGFNLNSDLINSICKDFDHINSEFVND